MRFGTVLSRRRLTASVGGAVGTPPVTFVLREDITTLQAAAIYHPSAAGFRYDIVAELAAGDGSITTMDESLAEALSTGPLDETGTPILVPVS